MHRIAFSPSEPGRFRQAPCTQTQLSVDKSELWLAGPPGSVSWFEEDHRFAIAKGNEVSILTVADTTSQNSPRLTYSSEISCIAASAQGHLVAFVAKQQVSCFHNSATFPCIVGVRKRNGSNDNKIMISATDCDLTISTTRNKDTWCPLQTFNWE